MGYILVVDDQEHNRDMLTRRLNRKGYETLAAEDGPTAIEYINSESIDLVLLDIRMPGMDGNEVLSIIRDKYSPTDLPVIMVTAEVDSESMVKSLGLGADDYVTKPIDLPVLLARMENKLALSRSVKERLAAASTSDTFAPTPDDVQATIKAGEGQNTEFKSTLRFNIRSGKIGKEIEIAWLKTVVAFLNTEGGTLLVGVSDDGEIIGTELDDFRNDDKYLLHVNNAVKRSIGMEFISHISFDLVPYEGKKVLYISCRPHTEPVFLKNGENEEFYARFGPASRKLSMKEMLKYVQNR